MYAYYPWLGIVPFLRGTVDVLHVHIKYLNKVYTLIRDIHVTVVNIKL